MTGPNAKRERRRKKGFQECAGEEKRGKDLQCLQLLLLAFCEPADMKGGRRKKFSLISKKEVI